MASLSGDDMESRDEKSKFLSRILTRQLLCLRYHSIHSGFIIGVHTIVDLIKFKKRD